MNDKKFDTYDAKIPESKDKNKYQAGNAGATRSLPGMPT